MEQSLQIGLNLCAFLIAEIVWVSLPVVWVPLLSSWCASRVVRGEGLLTPSLQRKSSVPSWWSLQDGGSTVLDSKSYAVEEMG